MDPGSMKKEKKDHKKAALRRSNILNLLYDRQDALTAKEINIILKIPLTSVYSNLNKLLDDGRVENDGIYFRLSSNKRKEMEIERSCLLNSFNLDKMKEELAKTECFYECVADIDDFESASNHLANYHMGSSYYTTCIKPPKFWMTGEFLFNCSNFINEDSDSYNKFLDIINEKCKSSYNIAECKHIGGKIEVSFKDEKEKITLEHKNNYVSLQFSSNRHDELKLVSRKGENGINVYKGKFIEKERYKQYFKLIDEKNIKKIRVFIKDIAAVSEDEWKERGDITNEFINEYNKDTKIYILKRSDIISLFKGDIAIINEKYIMKFNLYLSNPNNGYFVLTNRREDVEENLNLFRYVESMSYDPDKDPYIYWGLRPDKKPAFSFFEAFLTSLNYKNESENNWMNSPIGSVILWGASTDLIEYATIVLKNEQVGLGTPIHSCGKKVMPIINDIQLNFIRVLCPPSNPTQELIVDRVENKYRLLDQNTLNDWNCWGFAANIAYDLFGGIQS